MHNTHDKPSHPPAATSVAGLVEAWVSAGGIDTRYWRAGNGPCVLVLLDPATLAEAAAEWLLATLARSYRVLIPEMTHASTRTRDDRLACHGGWLHGLTEGLGIVPAGVIASTALEAPVRDYLSGRSDDPACVLWLQSPQPGARWVTTLETPGEVLRYLPLHASLEALARRLGNDPTPPRG